MRDHLPVRPDPRRLPDSVSPARRPCARRGTRPPNSRCVNVALISAAAITLLVGLIRDWTGSFDAAAILFVALGFGAATMGLGAGRALHVGARTIRIDG
ncbi:hypothetical protein [Ensifer oleiphilus]|uniref:hypothetical protein n=1 Tax=Ensifer oleiphilus TaxID=2742698 RepID=UPI003CCE6DD3